jgi:alkanesulfonate monooxygenase SsuD/methylene tetrahydromethanopterin reductase-like flavin-dependent oxidoreductase (luciferase family)
LTAPMEGFSRRYSSASEILQRMVASGRANYIGEREQRIDSLGNLDWEAIHTSEKAIVGTPDVVVDKIKEIGDALQLSGMVLEFNAGERLPEDKLNRSLELFCEKVAPAFA